MRDTALSALKVIQRKPLTDERGYLTRIFCAEELAKAGWRAPVAQINHTLTRKRGAVRGMHFQFPPHCEVKLVSCLRGVVWDVAVDVRAGSPTFLSWHGEELSPDNSCALLIPEGFAHGFQTLTDDVELMYLHSVAYSAQSEGGLNPRDPKVGIEWPLAISGESLRDQRHAMLTDDFQGVAP